MSVASSPSVWAVTMDFWEMEWKSVYSEEGEKNRQERNTGLRRDYKWETCRIARKELSCFGVVFVAS